MISGKQQLYHITNGAGANPKDYWKCRKHHGSAVLSSLGLNRKEAVLTWPLKERFNFFPKVRSSNEGIPFHQPIVMFYVFHLSHPYFPLCLISIKICVTIELFFGNWFELISYSFIARKHIHFSLANFWQPRWLKTNMKAFSKKLQRPNKHLRIFEKLLINDIEKQTVKTYSVIRYSVKPQNFETYIT